MEASESRESLPCCYFLYSQAILCSFLLVFNSIQILGASLEAFVYKSSRMPKYSEHHPFFNSAGLCLFKFIYPKSEGTSLS
jgi:hypothetical protein